MNWIVYTRGQAICDLGTISCCARYERKADVGRDAADAERNARTIQQKLDRLDEAFIYAKAIEPQARVGESLN